MDNEAKRRFIPQWGTPTVPVEIQEGEIAKMLQLVDSLRTAVEEGTVAALSIVLLRSNFVPEHAISCVPYSAAILLAGMDMAMDDLKAHARQVIMVKPDAGQASSDGLKN